MTHVSEDALSWTAYEHGEHTFRRKQLSQATDGEKLGCSLYEIDPGNRSWPYHYHAANEEALFVLEGNATARTPDGEQTLSAGDFAVFPTGEAGGHQIVNDSEGTFRCLIVSTMEEPDVTRYPEMEKFGVFVGSPPGGSDERSFEGYYPVEQTVEYWE